MATINIIFMVLWITLAILFLVIELVTLDLTSFWFSVGSLGALLSASLQTAYYWQILIFALLSVVCLISLKPIVNKTMKKQKNTKTNLDLIIGQKTKVVSLLDNEKLIGQVKVDGKFWMVTTDTNQELVSGQEVEVVGIKGVKLIVRNGEKEECQPQQLL